MQTQPDQQPEYKDKFICFIDLIGFKELVISSESGGSLTLKDILALLRNFQTNEDYDAYGPTACPSSAYIAKNLDFQLTQISDCVVVSTEVSPAGVINLLSYCYSTAFRFLKHGILCRGHITRGNIYHSPTQFIGTGYQSAYKNEGKVSLFSRDSNDTGTPYIEVDKLTCGYIDELEDPCISKQFAYMTRRDGDCAAIYPFSQLTKLFLTLSNGEDLKKELETVSSAREWLCSMREKILSYENPSDEKARRKTNHYLDALQTEFQLCDEFEQDIQTLQQPACPRIWFK